MFRTLLSTCSIAVLLSSGSLMAEMNFNRISLFATPENMTEGEDKNRETSPEIITATADGLTLVYTDSPLGVIGLIDLTDAKQPKPLGNIAVGGEPTSVALIGNNAFVGVNTSTSCIDPSGQIKVIDIKTKKEIANCVIGGQPDSVAVAKDGSFVVIAIENERDEDLNDTANASRQCSDVRSF